MALPKGKMFALLAVFVAIAMVAATGAFTSVEADRTVSVNVAEDSNALLQLEANGSSNNGDYVTTDGGQVVVDLDGSSGGTIGNGAEGINTNATTVINNTILVTNQGTQEVTLSVSSISGNGSTADMFLFLNDTEVSNSNPGNVNLPVGNTADIGLKFVVGDGTVPPEDFNATVTLSAEAT